MFLSAKVVALAKVVPLCYNDCMNGYDFDDTIFKGNCFRRFFVYCLLRLPYLILFLPPMLLAVLLRACRILTKGGYYFVLGWFVVLVPNIKWFVAKFWDKNINRVKQWYLDARQPTDVVVSASPAYLVQEACSRLGVTCIAANVSVVSARVTGGHCHGKNKVTRFVQQFGDIPLATYYSDSWSDTPMFKFAQSGYLVQGEKVTQVYQNGARM